MGQPLPGERGPVGPVVVCHEAACALVPGMSARYNPALGLHDEALGNDLGPQRLLCVLPGSGAAVAGVTDDLDADAVGLLDGLGAFAAAASVQSFFRPGTLVQASSCGGAPRCPSRSNRSATRAHWRVGQVGVHAARAIAAAMRGGVAGSRWRSALHRCTLTGATQWLESLDAGLAQRLAHGDGADLDPCTTKQFASHFVQRRAGLLLDDCPQHCGVFSVQGWPATRTLKAAQFASSSPSNTPRSHASIRA